MSRRVAPCATAVLSVGAGVAVLLSCRGVGRVRCFCMWCSAGEAAEHCEDLQSLFRVGSARYPNCVVDELSNAIFDCLEIFHNRRRSNDYPRSSELTARNLGQTTFRSTPNHDLSQDS